MLKKIRFLAVITAILLLSIQLAAADPFAKDDVAHIYLKKKFARWWVDIEKDNESFLKQFKVIIYSKKKLHGIILIQQGNKTLVRDEFNIDFYAERIFKINATIGTRLFVNITLTGKDYKKSVTIKLRVAKEKGALGKLQEIIEMTLKELQEYINRLKEKFYAYAFMFMIVGMMHAYIVKKVFLLESVKNPINATLFLLAILMYSAVAHLKEEHPILLLIYLVANVTVYSLLPLETIIIERFNVGQQLKIREEYVIYTKDGELYVAPQDARAALERVFLNKHIKLKMVKEGRRWTEIEEDVESDLLIVEDMKIREYAIVEKLEIEEEEETLSDKILQKVKPKIRRVKELIVDPASAHEYNIIKFIVDYWKSFKELSRKYERVVSENVRLRAQLSALSIERGRQLTVELLDLLDKTIFKGGENEQAV